MKSITIPTVPKTILPSSALNKTSSPVLKDFSGDEALGEDKGTEVCGAAD